MKSRKNKKFTKNHARFDLTAKKTKRVKYSIFNPKPHFNRSVYGNKKTKKHTLFPIMDSRFNLREVAKQMILLEQHIFNPKLRCCDCILKHSYTIEALVDEAVCLDKKYKYCSITHELSKRYHEIAVKIEDAVVKKKLSNDVLLPIAQSIRYLRKPLVKLTAGMLKEY